MNTYSLKYQKYKSKYINLKYTYLHQDQQGGAEQNLVFNQMNNLIECNDLAIGNPKSIMMEDSKKTIIKNVLSMVNKLSALRFSYDKLTNNFTVISPGDYYNTVLTMDNYSSDGRFCQLWGKQSGQTRQKFISNQTGIYTTDENTFILTFDDNLSDERALLFRKTVLPLVESHTVPLVESHTVPLVESHTVPLVESSAPSTVPSSDIGDIANYAYIWFNTSNPSETITEKEKDFIHETITKGTFPTYLQKYSDDERQALFTNEIEFVRQKFRKVGFSHITILQIPRILYDLFNLLFFYKTHPGQYATVEETIHYNRDDLITINSYIQYTNMNIEKCKDKIFELNIKIIDFLNTNGFLVSNTIVGEYKKILELIMYNISEIKVELRIQDSPRIDTPEKIKILYEILDFEKQHTSNSILLYRGADFTLDSTIEIYGDRKQYQYPSSISINLSILSAFLKDKGACTINFMTKELTRPNDKIKYTIKKFMFNDGSKEDSLFFIPPIPPYLQLYCAGELWHPRTKIGFDGILSMQRVYFKGLACTVNLNVELTYLKSNKTMKALEDIYQSYKTVRSIETWLRKYIKYKTKYLELKNQLGK